MKVVFRVDSSNLIGSGHLVRCLTLAEEIMHRNAEVFFICRELPGNLIDELTSRNHTVFLLPHSEKQQPAETQEESYQAWLGASPEEDAKLTIQVLQNLAEKIDWLVVDHYALDSRWEKEIKKQVQFLLVIDDLANRPHICDILLDQNLQGEEERYNQLVPFTCLQLLGPQFTLLRPEFTINREDALRRDGRIHNILILFGGIDPTNETGKSIEAILRLKALDISVTVVVGKNNPHRRQIEQMCSCSPNFRYLCQVDNIAELMVNSDLAIGAGGTTSWERCALGLPSLVISIADNQDQVCVNLNAIGAAVFLGKKGTVSVDLITDTIGGLRENPEQVARISRKAYELVDTQGTDRVVEEMLHRLSTKQAKNNLQDNIIRLRDALPKDKQQIFEWRNAPSTRRFFFNSGTITRDEHSKWFNRVMQADDSFLLIGEMAQKPIGVLRYDISGNNAEISIYLVPGMQGRGLGALLIKKGSEWLKTNQPAIRTVKAKVQAENKASINAFKKAGYDFDSQDDMLYRIY